MNTDLLKKFVGNLDEQKKLKQREIDLVPPEVKEIQARVKDLKAEEAEMRPVIVAHLKTEEVDKYSSPSFGTFSILPNSRWEYSDDFKKFEAFKLEQIKNLQALIDEARKEAEESGRAKKIAGEPTLRYQAAKS